MRARHDPIPNFVPVIPAKVKVTTGEEEEDTLYCGRAKLFHFIDKQWKERGVGDVKLLRNKTGKVRLLMRRDQILKICANHMLRPDMELSPVVNNNKAWFWVANDFANEEVKLEKLCIRFKTSDESMAFKEAFDQARHSLSAISLGKPPKNGKRASITFSSNKDSSKIQKSQLMQQAKTGSSVEVFLDKSKFDTTTLGEFSFSSEPIIQEVKDMEVGESKKTEEPPKVNSFSGFSFIESTGTLETKTTTDVSTPSANFVFGISTSLMNNSQSSVLTNTTANAYNVVSSCQQKLAKGSNPSEVAKELEKKSLMSKSKAQSVVEAKPLSELFKLLTDSWECSDCYTRNNAMDTKCVACQAPSPLMANNKSSSVITSSKYIESSNKPPLSELFNSGANCVYCVVCGNFKDPSQPPKPQQANIFQLNTSSSSAMPMTTFSFGIFKDTVSKESTTFNFRMPQAEDKSVSSKLKETTGIKGFVFCTPVKSSVALDANDSSFTFGSPAKSFDFNFTAKSPATLPGGGGETSKDEMVESENVYFSPIVPLPDKIEMKTGEENEEILYSYRAKLFRFDNAVEEWKERGLGDIKLLRHRETGKLRLIMRRDHVLKLCLNHIVSNDLEFTPKDEKSWFWSTADYSEDEIEYMQFACRFKTAEIAADFMKAIDNARKNVKLAMKIPTKTTTSPVKEIEIVYEAKATPEEKVAALKLQLPENFYAYKQKDCCSCRGCREPSIVLDPDVTGQDSSKVGCCCCAASRCCLQLPNHPQREVPSAFR